MRENREMRGNERKDVDGVDKLFRATNDDMMSG